MTKAIAIALLFACAACPDEKSASEIYGEGVKAQEERYQRDSAEKLAKMKAELAKAQAELKLDERKAQAAAAKR